MRLQAEYPAENDLFEGKSHENVAAKMADVIENADISIVGLEGELGSGKSTIIGLLRKKLENTHTFITFDAEKYHHGTTKRALIEVIFNGIKKTNPRNIEKLTIHKDKALGNILEYTKNVKSRISWWTILFILFSLVSAQTIRYALTDINTYITKPDAINWKTILGEAITVISPLILVGILFLINRFSQNRYISVGDLFKKNSEDTITEKILVNKEVGAIELTEALRGFSGEDVLRPDQKFILVLDNLDRVSPEKVKELWSDMELICGAASGPFKIIVPYSSRHVAAALKVEDSNGYEFISKRIPVNFTVPPLITAGWQEVFIRYWNETVSTETVDAKETIRIIERWLPEYYKKITPRLLKKVVNDIHILSLTVGENHHRYVLIALYLFVTRYNFHDLKTLISNPELLTESEKINAALIEKLKDTRSQLWRLFPNREQEWSEYIISVHYQSEVNIARSELIDAPLLAAVNDKKPEEVEELSTIWGFISAWERCFTRFDLISWIIVLSRLGRTCIDSLSTEIKATVNACNLQIYQDAQLTPDKPLAEAIYSLYKSGVFGKEEFMNRRYQQIINKMDLMHEHDTFDKENVNDILFEVNAYSDIYSVNILIDEVNYYVSGKLYVEFLVNHMDDFPYLKIEEIKLAPDEIKSAVQHVIFNPGFINLLHPMLTKHISVGFSLKDSDAIVSDNINNIMLEFKQGSVISNFDAFELLILHPSWQTEDLSSAYGIQTDFIKNNTEQYCAHLIAHMIAANIFNGISLIPDISDTDKFNDTMFSYMCWQHSFSRIVDALKEDRLHSYILPALTRVIEQNRISLIDVQRFITKDYTLLSSLMKNVYLLSPLKSKLTALERHLNTIKIESLSPMFLSDINGEVDFTSVNNQLMLKALDVLHSEATLTEYLSKVHPNTDFIFGNYHCESEKDVFSGIDVKSFSGWFRNVDKKSLSMHSRLRTVFCALPSKVQREIVRSLCDILYDRSVDVARRIALIHCFGDEVNYVEAERNEPRRTIAALYPESVSDITLSTWLDRQELSFSKWPNEDVITALDIILEHQELFPRTCITSRYVANRIKELSSEEVSNEHSSDEQGESTGED